MRDRFGRLLLVEFFQRRFHAKSKRGGKQGKEFPLIKGHEGRVIEMRTTDPRFATDPAHGRIIVALFKQGFPVGTSVTVDPGFPKGFHDTLCHGLVVLVDGHVVGQVVHRIRTEIGFDGRRHPIAPVPPVHFPTEQENVLHDPGHGIQTLAGNVVVGILKDRLQDLNGLVVGHASGWQTLQAEFEKAVLVDRLVRAHFHDGGFQHQIFGGGHGPELQGLIHVPTRARTTAVHGTGTGEWHGHRDRHLIIVPVALLDVLHALDQIHRRPCKQSHQTQQEQQEHDLTAATGQDT